MFSINSVGTIKHLHAKVNLNTYFMPDTKINSKKTMDLKVIIKNKPSGQIYDSTHRWNLTKQMNIWEGGEEESETNHKRLLTIENKLRVDGGRWVGDGLDG